MAPKPSGLRLDPPAFDRHLAAKKLLPVYLLYGEDVKRLERAVNAIEDTIDPGDRPFAVERIYAGEDHGSAVNIAAAGHSLPMLGDRRIVFVLRAEKFLKPKRAAKAAEADEAADAPGETEAADVDALEAYLEDPVPSTTMVFVASDIDGSRRLVKQLVKTACVVEFGWGVQKQHPSQMAREMRAAAVALIQQEMTAAKRTLAPAAVQQLIQHAGSDINRLRGDLERLLIYTEGQTKISAEDVSEIISSEVAVDDEWAVTNAIAAGDAAKALVEAARRLERGDSPHAMIGQLRWWVSNRMVESDPRRVRTAIEALLRTDLALKSSGGDDRVLIERLVVELTSGVEPRSSQRRF